MTPEGRIKEKVKKLCKKYGAYYFMPVQTGYGTVGLDFYICHNGNFYGIETKSPNGVATSRQEKVMDNISTANGVAFIVKDEASLARLEQYFKSYHHE